MAAIAADEDTDLMLPDLFTEPEGYYKPDPPPTTATHRMRSGKELYLRLVGHDPLWGHYLWNAARVNALYLDDNAPRLIRDRDVLELGSGAGLPSLVCIEGGARSVVITDYPNQDLMDNLRLNVKALQDGHQGSPDPCRPAVRFEGYIWGYPPEPLVRHTKDAAGFDTIILADLIFNHSQHASLINSVRGSLERSPQSVALVFFTSHRPHLQHKDLAFFDLAREAGFAVAQVHEQVMEKPMFEVDQGDELTRRTVSGYELTWLPSSLLP